MKKLLSIVVPVVAFTAIISFAQASEKGKLKMPSEVIPDGVPEEYIIKKGDTLWDISEKFLTDPFRWPVIWEKNDYIKDPHWIYPGQILLFKPPKPPPPPLKPLPKPEPVFIKAAPLDSEAMKEEPETTLSLSVQTPDDSNVLKKLPRPRLVFTQKSFMRTGFISKRAELPESKVIDVEGESKSATKYDIIMIKSAKGASFREGDTLAALTIEDRVKHPDTGEVLGHVVRVKGIMIVISVGKNQTRCRITENFDPIARDDLVMPIRLKSGAMFDAWVKPDVAITGTILARNEPMLSIHPSDILYIDKGSEDGVKPGDRFDIFSSENKLDAAGHSESLGELTAVNVMSGETAVLVISLKGKHINIGDRVELTARCRLME